MADLPPFLYRGFDPDRYVESAGGLAPRAPGQPFKHTFHAGEVMDAARGRVLTVDDGVVAGDSDVNATIRHQSDPEHGWKDSGISTTPFQHRAEHYATHAGARANGEVLVIDTSLLARNRVIPYRVRTAAGKPAVPEDDEYILVAGDCGALPEAIVVRRYQTVTV